MKIACRWYTCGRLSQITEVLHDSSVVQHENSNISEISLNITDIPSVFHLEDPCQHHQGEARTLNSLLTKLITNTSHLMA